MHSRAPRVELGVVLVAAAAYVVVGLLTAALAGRAATNHGTITWRLVAWLLSLIIFVAHLAFSRRSRRLSVPIGAWNVALAVAVAAFVLAAVGPVRSHWRDAHMLRIAVSSLVAWPLLAGVPAFLVALLGGYMIDRA